MKQIIKSGALAFLAAGVLSASMTSCNKEPERYNPQPPKDQMHVTASAESVTLVKENADKPAITLKWGQAFSHGADYTIAYYVRLRHAEMPDTYVSDPIEIAAGVMEKTFTVEEINKQIAMWNIFPGDEVIVQAQVMAVSSGGAKFQMPETSSVMFTATGYDMANYLSMVITRDGSESVIALSEEVVSTDVFLWSGTLKAGDKLRFVRSAVEGTWPAYVQGATVGSLKLAASVGEGSASEIGFTIPSGLSKFAENETYQVRADMGAMSYEVRSLAKMGMVGNALAIGWDNGAQAVLQYRFTQPNPMTEPHIWTTSAYIKSDGGSEFKLVRPGEWDGFWPQNHPQNPFVSGKMGDYNDNKWVPPAGTDGTFIVTIDIEAMTLVMK